MSKEDSLDKLIERLEAGYITREEFEVLKADLIASKRVPTHEEKIDKPKEDSSSSKSGMWKWIVGGLVLCAGGYVGFDMSLSLYNGKEIPSGSFTMGCTSGQGSRCAIHERPIHEVTISRGFVLMESEVTQALYQKVMGENPSHFKGMNRPVEDVSWFDAVNMANKLSVLEGLEECYVIDGKDVQWLNEDCTGWRLPTEAEWEYAARGGDYSHKYAGSNNVADVAWYGNNSQDKTRDVCEKTRNGYGLCDMSGNVYEWVWDKYGDYSSSPSVDPRGPTSGSRRLSRGGSWYGFTFDVLVSGRNTFDPAGTRRYLGFRLARTSP